MSDDVDKANEEIQNRLTVSLNSVNTSIENNETGKCIWCEKKVIDTRRWCSADCRDEHTLYANKL